MPVKHTLKDRFIALTAGCVIGAIASFVAVAFADLPKGALALVPVCALGAGLVTFVFPRSMLAIMAALEGIAHI